MYREVLFILNNKKQIQASLLILGIGAATLISGCSLGDPNIEDLMSKKTLTLEEKKSVNKEEWYQLSNAYFMQELKKAKQELKSGKTPEEFKTNSSEYLKVADLGIELDENGEAYNQKFLKLMNDYNANMLAVNRAAEKQEKFSYNVKDIKGLKESPYAGKMQLYMEKYPTMQQIKKINQGLNKNKALLKEELKNPDVKIYISSIWGYEQIDLKLINTKLNRSDKNYFIKEKQFHIVVK